MKKTNKILTAIVMALTIVCFCQPISASAASAKPIVKATQTVISKGTTTKVKVTYNKKNVTNKAKFKTSNKSVATVSKKGVVTGKKTGTAYITATYKGKTSKKVKITVAQVSLDKKSVKLTVGKTYTLKATYNKKRVKATFKSSNTNVASVNKAGVITAKKAGTATITATYKNSRVSCKVEVTEKPHTHNYKPVYTLVHHEEEGHYEEQQVLVKDAWDEERGHYEEQQVLVKDAWDEEVTDGAYVCNTCGMKFISGEYETDVAALEALEEHQWDDEVGDYTHNGYHSETITYTKHYDAKYETQNVWIVDKTAYDEKVVDYYKCECGATHK